MLCLKYDDFFVDMQFEFEFTLGKIFMICIPIELYNLLCFPLLFTLYDIRSLCEKLVSFNTGGGNLDLIK